MSDTMSELLDVSDTSPSSVITAKQDANPPSETDSLQPYFSSSKHVEDTNKAGIRKQILSFLWKAKYASET